MTTQRERILAYLRSHPAATVAELESALRLRAAAIRHHLRALEAAGLVRGEALSSKGRGRPRRRYRLVSGLRGQNLLPLLRALFSLLAERGLRGEALAEALADVLGRAFAEPAYPIGQAQRLRLTLEFLQRSHYHPRWEAAAYGPRLFLQHCPYLEVLAEHPELCEMDRLLLQRCLKQRVTLLSRADWEGGHAPACIFQVQE